MKESNKGTQKKFFNEWIVPVLLAIIIAILINKFLIFKIVIPSGSMIPTINIDDRIFVTRIYNYNNLKRGDIVVFYSEEFDESMIKRLIGLPGDVIDIQNGVVSVNGEELVEDYIGEQDTYTGHFEVPEGEYFFLGDNRKFSKDSRYWQDPYISQDKIEGKAQIRVYPLSDFGKVE